MKFKQLLRPRGLGAYLALAFSIMSVILTLVLVEVVERSATEEVKAVIGHGLAELALQTADKLDRGMAERYREVGLMAARADLADPATGTARRREALAKMQESYGYYGWIGMAGLDGRVQVAAHGLLEGADVSGRPWFKAALRGVHVGDVHEAVLLARLLPNNGGEPLRFVDIAFPYHGADGKARGVLGVHLSWQWARDVEQSIIAPIAAQRRVEALVVDAKGVVLLGPPALQGKTLDQASFRAARAGRTGYLVERWPDGGDYLVGLRRSRGHGKYPGLGWTVLVRQNLDTAYLPVRRVREQALLSGVLLALLFSVAGVVVAHRITRPLGALARSARRIRRGEVQPLAVGEHSYAEVKALGGTLNALVADLVQRRQELQDLNATLEQRVVQRTGELEQALLAVQANEQRIATIVEAAQDAFVGVDLAGAVTDWNWQAERMFGWSREEAVGRPLAELVVPARYRASVDKALGFFNETGRSALLGRRIERLVVDRAGVEFPIEMTAGLAGTTETAFISVFLHDISERKKIERMKSEFVATVSHELRTPLTSIRASLALLADGTAGELPADIQGLVGIAYQSCERLVRLVNDVLDIQKIEAGKMEFVRRREELAPLVDLATDAMLGYARQMEVTLERDRDENSGALAADIDHDRITQVLTNLLSNAIKFSHRGGVVRVGLRRRDGQACFTVRDQGSGIPEQFRDRVFQPFAQADAADSRQKGGTGLGLSICHSIVEQHGGSIGFDTVSGEGTTFYVTLPAA